MIRLLPANVAVISGLLHRTSINTFSTVYNTFYHSITGRRNPKISSLFQTQLTETMSPPTTRHMHENDRSARVPQLTPDRLVWVDLEMTGLDVVNDRILEIACLVTEKDLQIVAEGPDLVIHESDDVLNNMGEWCTEQHGKSGLTDAVRSSKISVQEAEQMVLDFIKEHTPKGTCPLAGNSIGVDRSFIERHMPRLAEHLHYRVIDVSSVKELCRRWYPEDLRKAPAKKETHRAMDDIRESIAELQFYRSAIFR